MTPPITMPAETGSTLIQHYAEVRARLYGRRPVVRRAACIAPEPEPEPEIGPTPEPAFIVTYVEPPPLVMLGPCSWRFLVALTAVRHGLQPQEIISPSRARPVALARHEAIYLIAKHTPLSLLRISRLLRRNHTTILSSLKKFPKLDRRHLGYGGGIVRYSSSKPMVSPVVHTVHS